MKQRIWLSPPHLSGKEITYIQQALSSNYVTTAGENIDAFEKAICNYTGASYAVALSSGTAAIHLALLTAGVGAGDEVLCSSFTFVATANPILYCGAIPVFVDSERQSWNMSPAFLEEAIKDRISKGKKPKAIVVVHLYGQSANMQELCVIADKYSITLIEDAAEALGSWYNNKHTGTFGKMGIFSFNGNKIITTSGGGALVTDDKALAERVRFFATQAKDAAPYYLHSQVGYNYRLSNILAGIGIGQMEVLEDRIAKRKCNFEYYKNNLKGINAISFPEGLPESDSNRWLSCMIIDKSISTITPTDVITTLEKENIEARRLWKPMHTQPLFKDYPYYGNGCAEQLFESGICLPSGSQLTEPEKEAIVTIIKKLVA